MADEKKAAFGVFPQMKPRRSRQDPEAAKDVPRQLLRGWAAGTLGLPGDIEGLIRMLPGLDETPRLPTSEFYLDYLPGKAQGAAGEAAAGLGTLFGGLGSTKVARGALETAKAAGKAGRAALETVGTGPSPGGLVAQRGVIKMPGGNWISGNVERAVEPLKRKTAGGMPAEAALEEMRRVYTPEAMERLSPETVEQVTRGIPQLERDAALNKWVDRNLTNYIKKQMGTPDDPVRKLIEETGSAHIPLDRSWEPESLPSRRKAAGFPIEGFAAKKLNELPAGANEKTISDLEKAIEWESRTDQIIGNLPVKEWQAISNPKFEAANSWMSKVDPNTMAYRVAEHELRGDLGFDHILDVLRQDLDAGRIRPEQLNKVSMEQAVRRTYEYDQEMAKKMAEAKIKATEGMPVYKEYPEGYKWIELKANKDLPPVDDGLGNMSSPGYTQLEDALKYEGETMGHCVGGYCDDVYEGRSRIFSLRDAKGEPHVTVEVQPIAPDWQGVKKAGGDPSAIMTEAKRRMGIDTPENEAELLRSMNGDQRYNLQKELDRHFADVFKEQFGDISPNIVQIKGKQNRAPKEEYLPFVQDFVRSGQWSDVGDFQNTGLVKVGSEYVPKQEVEAKIRPRVNEALQFLETHPSLEQFRAAQRAYDEFRGDVPSPEYTAIQRAAGKQIAEGVPYTYRELEALLKNPEEWVERGEDIYGPLSKTLEQIDRARKLLGEIPPTEGMKRGGKVRFSDNPDTMRLELSIGGFVKGAKAAKAAAAEQKAAAAQQQALKRASEVLGEREGHPLMITQTDRSKVGGKWLGGPGFSGLQHTRPEYKEAEAAWGVASKPVAKTIVGGYEQAKKQFGKEPVVTTMIGTPTQHQSNKMVFEELHRLFTKSAKQGNLTPELLSKINDRLRSAVDKDGKNLFPEDVNILSPDFRKIANTFDRRGIASNLMGGVQVGGKKGQIIDYDEVIRHTTDPALIDVPTGSLGNRMFTLSGNIIERPDLHPAFPTILQGEDLGKTFAPVPREVVMRDFIEKTIREKGRDPGYFDYNRGYPPVQLLTEELLTQMQKAGYADGGAVTMAEGGEITADDLIIEERPL